LGHALSHGPRQRQRHRNAGGVVDRALAMGMAVDMRADHRPIRTAARQIGNQHGCARGMILAVENDARGCRRAVRERAQRLGRLGGDAERGDACAAVASARS
jgi:hypothetical protein